MRPSLSLGFAMLIGLTSAVSHAQTVQATLSISLTAEISVPTSSGSKIEKLRLSTRDMVDDIKAELGITGRGGSLVARRQIDDFENDPELFVIVNRVAYPVPDDPIEDIQIELPDSYFAYVEAVKLRRSDLRETEIKSVEPIAFGFGSLDDDGYQATLVGLERITLKLLTRNGVDIGYLLSSGTQTVTGGMDIADFGYGPMEGVMTGEFKIGSEKLLP